jgi:hypothetical protein
MSDSDRPDTQSSAGGEEMEPNEYGFAGGATAPEPERERSDPHDHAEDVAVPSGDLTGAISDSITEETTKDDEDG